MTNRMTKEEAIKILKDSKAKISPHDLSFHFVEHEKNEALEMAIKALEQEPCEDAISRQVVKNKYRESLIHNLTDNDRGIDLSKYAEKPYKAFCEFINSIPSVTPQPFINKPCVSEGVCREDKMQVLDKIRAEIKTMNGDVETLSDVLDIIDRYKVESEKINCKTTKCENCKNHNYCDFEPQESEGKE